MATNNTQATNNSTATDTQSSGPQSNTPLAGFALWVAGWALIILVIFLLSRSRAGQAIVYYIAWLSIALLLVTHADSIQTLFQQANITQGQF